MELHINSDSDGSKSGKAASKAGKGSPEMLPMRLNLNVDGIVEQMSKDVRRQVEHAAWACDQSLKQFVQDQLVGQLAEHEFQFDPTAVRFDRWDVGVDSRPTDGSVRVGGGIRGRF